MINGGCAGTFANGKKSGLIVFFRLDPCPGVACNYGGSCSSSGSDFTCTCPYSSITTVTNGRCAGIFLIDMNQDLVFCPLGPCPGVACHYGGSCSSATATDFTCSCPYSTISSVTNGLCASTLANPYASRPIVLFSRRSLSSGYMWLWWFMFVEWLWFHLHLPIFVKYICYGWSLCRYLCEFWSITSKSCFFLLDPCLSSPCHYGGVCSSNSGGFTCSCPFSSSTTVINGGCAGSFSNRHNFWSSVLYFV